MVKLINMLGDVIEFVRNMKSVWAWLYPSDEQANVPQGHDPNEEEDIRPPYHVRSRHDSHKDDDASLILRDATWIVPYDNHKIHLFDCCTRVENHTVKSRKICSVCRAKVLKKLK